MIPQYKRKATVLQDGHIDHITGPRCLIVPADGPMIGRYLIAHTDQVLKAGQPVIYDEITRRAKAEGQP